MTESKGLFPSLMNPSNVPSAPVSDTAVVLDVRPLPGRTKHATIFQRWFDLAVGGHFILLNDHDPVPLKYQFEAEYPGAFAWEYLQRGPEEFRVKITKRQAVPGPAPQPPARQAAPSVALAATATVNGVQEIDVRGLEPPEPLVRILDALETLPAGTTLRARTDREPCHLFGEVAQRGFSYECNEQPDGSWITVLARA
jgi:uncharacterized protein (DUF2249 family)